MSSLDRAFYLINLDVIELWFATMILLIIFFALVLWFITYILKTYNIPLLNEYKGQINEIKGELNAIRREVAENIKSVKGTDKTA